MTTTIAIGNCPSSGSTLFSDLLDSSPYTASGPELNLFALESLYHNDGKTDLIDTHSKCSSVYLRRNSLVENDLCAYGLDITRLRKILTSSDNLSDILSDFAENFLSLRGKNIKGVVFEKSPQNIHCIKEYLESTSGYFVHIVRNPINVYKSLLKRGFLPGIALITWLVDEAKIFNYLDDDRLIVVRYEDLLLNPYKITSEIIKKITGYSVDEKDIEYNYMNNEYRKHHTVKLSSWTNKEFGKVGKDNKKVMNDSDVSALVSLRDIKVSKEYAEYFGLAEVSFVQLLETFDYLSDYNDLPLGNESDFHLSLSEKNHLFRKFISDIRAGDSTLKDIHVYMNPVEKI